MESFWVHFKGENVSLFLDAATLEELEWVIGRQMNYYNCERRHSSLDYRGIAPKTLAENGVRSGSAPGRRPVLCC
ncbi:MAG: transposase [Deltaproteobacteria bacterium]|nr:transposase [Deltaproteobacteria bacterium]